MFDLIKSIIWIILILIVGYFMLYYFGYEVNTDYFFRSKEKCQEKINECTQIVIHKGLDSSDECNFKCVDPKLIIKKAN